MKRGIKTRLLTTFLLAASLIGLSGCNVLAIPYFAYVFLGGDIRVPPMFVFPEDAKRVAVVTTTPIDMQLQAGHVDHELNSLVAWKLANDLSYEKETKHVEVLKADVVSRWQDEHPNWSSAKPSDIGVALDADYVVLVEVENIDFFEDGSSRQLLQGSADMHISVIRVDNSGGEVVFRPEPLTIEVPKGRPIPVTDMPLIKFRRMFLGRAAEKIVWLFVPHEQSQDFARDPI